MKILLLFMVIVMLAMSAPVKAQDQSSQINNRDAPIDYYQKKGLIFKKNVYRKCDVEMNARQLGTHFAQKPSMASYGKSILWNDAATKILYGVGQGFILWPVLQEIDGSDPNWTWAWVGLGCIAASIPFKLITDNKCRRAVEHYNSNVIGSSEEIKLDLVISAQGAGVQVRF